jgi:hypothetical protein
MDLGEVGWGDVDWIGLAQDRNRWRALCEFGIEPSGSMKCWETIKWPTSGGLSSSAQLHRVSWLAWEIEETRNKLF